METSKHYIDKIEVRNKRIFGDNEAHTLEMDFMDGCAISLDGVYIMSYPTVEQVGKTYWMQQEILEYCGDGRKGDFPFDIALKFGVLFKMSAISKLQSKVMYLEDFLKPEDQDAYAKFCEDIELPERSYYALYQDRTGDSGMSVKYIGECISLEEAKKAARNSLFIPPRAEQIDNPKSAIDGDVCLQKDTQIDCVFVDNNGVSTEYWAILSRELNLEEEYCVLIWNRDSKSVQVPNLFYIFDNKGDMDKCFISNKKCELSHEIETMNDTWFVENLSDNCGLIPIEGGHKNIHVWGNEGYEVDLVNGTFK